MNPALIAIIGASGSGKSALALELAQSLDAEIVSLDSLSAYKDFNIAAAKPSAQDLQQIKHYGVNLLEIYEKNSAPLFKQELERAIATTPKKILLLVGGSGFYLKAILEGLSPMPTLNPDQQAEIACQIASLDNPHAFLAQLDNSYAKCINPKDTYRTLKALEIYFATHTPPSQYFATHPKIPFDQPIKLYVLDMPKESLHANIAKRTQDMLNQGIIDETEALAKKHGSGHQPFRAIGPKECLQYLRQELSLKGLYHAIYTHTCQLAKRQNTFNRTQFKNALFLDRHTLLQEISRNINALSHVQNS